MRPSFRMLAAVALVSVGACDSVFSTSTSSTATIAPVTGLEVRAEDALEGLGCGRGANEALRWGGVIFAAGSETPIAANLVECFADLVFHGLPRTDAAVDRYRIELVAFRESDWNALDPALQADLASGKPEAFARSNATWRTSCEGVQEQGFRREATCVPFTAPRDAGATFDAQADAGADAGADASAPLDATADATP
jgi:hypothetical protein